MVPKFTWFMTSRFFPMKPLKKQNLWAQPHSLVDLPHIIIKEYCQIAPEILYNVRQRFEPNIYVCMEDGGDYSQYLINDQRFFSMWVCDYTINWTSPTVFYAIALIAILKHFLVCDVFKFIIKEEEHLSHYGIKFFKVTRNLEIN